MAKRKNKYVIREGWYRLKDLPKGEFVKKTPGSKKVYVKGNYDSSSRRFLLDDYNDIDSGVYVKGSAEVWAGFEY